MTTPSNLYAEAIFSQQPLEMWALDEQTSYLSWIDESQRNLKVWGSADSESFSVYTYQDDPEFDDSQYSQDSVKFSKSFQQQINVGLVESPEIVISLYSPELKFNSSQIDPVSGCISFGTMFLSNDEKISKVRIGYVIDKDGQDEQEDFKECHNLKYGDWVNLLETFALEPTEGSFSVRMVLEITVLESADSVDMFFNGIVAGQGAEYFSNQSLGISYGSIPDTIYLPEPFFSPGNPGEEREGIEITPYGLSDAKGYYLIYNDFELVSQSGIPMVYGSNTSTVLNPTPNKDIPNIILPARGFMNELNNNRTRTFEFWMKLNHNGTSDSGRYKIFGPIASDDGVYVDEAFISIKVGDSTASAFVKEWNVPMLVHVCVTEENAYLMIDGVILASVYHNGLSQKYKDEYDQDWVGFYAPKEIIDSIEIDCVAVYTYDVREEAAKIRHFIGQGQEFPLAINTAYGGTSAIIDFVASGYSKTQDYPEKNRWSSGFGESVVLNQKNLSCSTYAYPEVSYVSPNNGSREFENWSKENYDYMTASHPNINGFKPDPTGSSNAYLSISNLADFSGIPMFAVSGMAIINSLDDGNQIMSLVSRETLGKITVSIKDIDGDKALVYSVENADGVYDVASVDIDAQFSGQDEFVFGFTLEDFCTYVESLSVDIYESAISLSMSEFRNPGDLSLYIGADDDTDTSIDAIFTKFAIMTENDFYRLIDEDENVEAGIENSIFNYTGEQYLDLDTFRDFNPIYEIRASLHYPENFIGIGSYSYWSDSIPLSSMMSQVSNSGEIVSDLDFIQINVGYPSNINSKIFKSYICFQYATGFDANVQSLRQRQTIAPAESLVVDPGSSWSSKKYEIKDGSIVYVPLDEGENTPEGIEGPFDLSNIIATILLEFRVDSQTSQPISISSIQIAPVSIDYDTPHKVGTKYAGEDIFPSLLNDGEDISKSKTPYRIYRGSEEYLYLTSKSGIELCYDNDAQRNLYIDINKTLQTSFNISSIQFAFSHRGYFSETEELAFQIVSDTQTIDFYIQSTNSDNTRAIMFAKVGSQYFNDLKYYINGIEVRSPVLKRGEWNMLGMSFSPALSFPSIAGKFRIFSKVLLNNFSYYQISDDLINQYQVFKVWADIEDFQWAYWESNTEALPNTWGSLKTTSESSAISIDAVDIYKIFVGTNKIISDSRSDDLSFAIPYYQYSIYNNVFSKTYVKKPV